MLRADATVAATIAREHARIALPLEVARPATQAGFGALYREVNREVRDFIAGAEPGAPRFTRAFTLGAEASVRRAWLSPPATSGVAAPPGEPGVPVEQQQAFLERIAPWARQAASRLGVAPELVAAHAALESGWGQRPLRDAHGASTHNLFGIKAGSAWRGPTVEAATTEYEGAAAQSKVETFRRYADPASAFEDYVAVLSGNERYRAVLDVGSDALAFARGLMRGGYATDPGYAGKLASVVRQVRALGLALTTPQGGRLP